MPTSPRFSSILLRSESASSSLIENLSSGAQAVAVAELGDTSKRNATEIVGNVAAMRAAVDVADRLDADAALAMHRALLQHVAPDTAGRWREQQVWIGGSWAGPHQAEYVAPHHRHVPALMDDVMAFVARGDLPPLVLAAVAHAQFETIHPFPDGNGRTGRALIHAILRSRGLDPFRDGARVTRGSSPTSTRTSRRWPRTAAATPCRSSGGSAPRRSARWSTDASWSTTCSMHASAGGRSWWPAATRRRGRLADLLLRQPVVDAATVVRELGVTVNNAPRAIAPLVDAGVLTEFTGFKRNRMWQASEVLTALDAFAARAGRRTR